MYQIDYTNRFRKDVKILKKRHYNFNLLKEIVQTLEKDGALPNKFSPHILSGNYSRFWEAHIKSDWLIIWHLDVNRNTISLVRTGTHSDLF